MSDSENDIDYAEILITLNEKNAFLQNQVQNTELREKYEESFKKYSELRNVFLNMKDEFEINQIKIFKLNILLADSRNQLETQMSKLEELKRKNESLGKKSSDQQLQFENTVRYWSDKINELSTTLDQDSQQLKIQEGLLDIDSLMKKIERIRENHVREVEKRKNKYLDYDFKAVKQLTEELLEDTKDYEEKTKNCTELESEINEFGIITDDIQKQLN